MLDRVTLKQGRTHCVRRLIMDQIAHVVTDSGAYLEQNQPSGAADVSNQLPVYSLQYTDEKYNIFLSMSNFMKIYLLPVSTLTLHSNSASSVCVGVPNLI